jgi:hypothetical protein
MSKILEMAIQLDIKPNYISLDENNHMLWFISAGKLHIISTLPIVSKTIQSKNEDIDDKTA